MSGGARTVSLNGCDNVGKTTELQWLARGTAGVHVVGTIDRWHPGWTAVAGENFAGWWFSESSTAQHVELVMSSHQARRAASGPLALEDRGHPMLLASCAATAVVKDGLTPERALATVTTMASRFPAAERKEIHVLLRHTDRGPAAEAKFAVDRDPHPPSGWYSAYQHALAQVLELQTNRDVYDVVLVRGEASILELQRRIRAYLTARGFPVKALPADTPKRVWALGGMSEAGKSTVAELLAAEHGASRLKIGYLLELAALRSGIANPYTAWSEREQAERLVEEILLYCTANKASVLSVESAHRFQATLHLRRCLGDRCRIVYVAAAEHVRVDRAVENRASVLHRDAVKAERGADRIAEMADVVIDNSGPLSALKLALPALPAAASTSPPSGWHPVTEARWLTKAAEHLVDEHVAMLLATGGTGRGSWLDSWSDIDLLVVRDEFSLDWLRTTPPALPDSGGRKVGLSCFTPGELAGGHIPPRVVHALRQAERGEGVLYLRSGYRPPTPTAAEDDRASRGELGLVLMTTRRLLAAPTPDVRALHKHMVLLAKIVLRAEGRDIDDPDEVQTAFSEAHPDAAVPVIPVHDAAALARSSEPDGTSRLLAAVATFTEYIDRFATMIRRNS